MNNRLSHDDFSHSYDADKHYVVIGDEGSVFFDTDKEAKQFEQQILNNQAIVEKVKDFFDSLTVVDGHITNRLAYDELRIILQDTKHSKRLSEPEICSCGHSGINHDGDGCGLCSCRKSED